MSFIINPYRFASGNDPHWSSVKLLLHMDGSNNSTTFTDSSAIGRSVTAHNGAKLTTTGPKFGTACGTFASASLDYLNITDSDDFAFGSGDFTIEFWAYPLSSTASGVVVAQWGSSQNSFWLGAGFGLGFYISTNGTNSILALPLSSWPGGANTWQHVAVSRSGANLRLFVDGTQRGSTYNISTNALHNSTNSLRICADHAGLPFFNGKLDDLRITKGVARYTANFTPPSAPFPDS